jgi:flagellar basal body P-ring protein FlgI
MPEFTGKLLVADNNNGRIYKCDLGNSPFFDTVATVTQVFDVNPLTTLMQGSDGFIYALNGGYQPSGMLYRIKPSTVGVNNNSQNTPETFVLKQNYPNPFNPSTTITYAIAKPAFITLKVYNTLGEEVASLVNENKAMGSYTLQWDASNLPSGVYMYKITVNDFTAEKKMVLLK